MNILVTGAAGYIGSVVSEQLVGRGYDVVALDNLSQGHRAAVPPEAIFVEADLGDIESLRAVFDEHRVDAVMHLAASTLVGESMTAPSKYFRNNLVSGLNLLDVMIEAGVPKLVFSSSCAVYGEPVKLPMDENHPQAPVNTYGDCKLMFEKVLRRYAYAYGVGSISLRYFNAAGATEQRGEDHNPETHVIPNVIRVALGKQSHVTVFGTDYPTDDGTCVRDYVHVRDIAQAHVLALDHVDGGARAYNLGNGLGFSVREVIAAVAKVTGQVVPTSDSVRRAGDSAVLIADSRRAREELGWEPEQRSLEAIVADAWNWHRQHLNGYVDGKNATKADLIRFGRAVPAGSLHRDALP